MLLAFKQNYRPVPVDHGLRDADSYKLQLVLAYQCNGQHLTWLTPEKKHGNSLTFTRFMLASKRSCCIAFFIVVKLEEPDILGAFVGFSFWKQSDGSDS